MFDRFIKSGRDAIRVVRVVIVRSTTSVHIAEIVRVRRIRGTLPPVGSG